ncbi:arsenate reductase ArsC [Litorimonas sp. RW-G-Af-16]|uniref:arsenate reductase ArsC n=1 Tax=Litorimonas sp. RW-G-Af-16 TaxID=3241168 RepID=UPI00390CD2FB
MTETIPTTPINVLFLCTGNSARSILSEALVNDLGQGRFLGWSAGSHPSGQPHPDGLKELSRRGHRTDLYRSKSWDEFEGADAPRMDIVVTVCDNAANEVCPVFPGDHISVHWPAPDPAHVEPIAVRQQAFADVYDLCRARIEALIALPQDALADRATVQAIAGIST